MTSAVDRVQLRLQEAMDQGNQASLGQAIDASKGVNGLKQLRRSAKARLKQLSADQNRNMIGSHMPPEEPLTWRTSEQGGRYRAVAHLPTSIIGWVIGHKGCNARMLKQQTGTELWVDVPGQCVIIESRAVQEVEGGMEAVNGFVKTAPTFIAKVQSGGGGGITQTVQCPVHLLPSIQRLSRKIQAESGANCVFANCKMSTFCVTGDRKNVDSAVAMLKRLIAEGHTEPPPANGNPNIVGNGNVVDGVPGGPVGHVNGSVNGNVNGNINGHVNGHANGNVNGHGGDRRGPGPSGMRGMGVGVGPAGVGELVHRMGRVESDMSRSDGSPPTAPCSPETASAANAWGNGAPSQLRTSLNVHQPEPPPASSLIPVAMNSLPPPGVPVVMMPAQHPHLPVHYPASAPATPGDTAVAPFQGASAVGGRGGGGGGGVRGGGGGGGGVSGGGPSSDLSFFSFAVDGVNANIGAPAPGGAPGGAPVVRASTAPTPGVSGGGGGGGGAAGLGGGSGSILPGLGFLEESSGAGNRLGFEHDYVDDERRSSCGSGEFGGGEAHGFPQHTRRPGSVGSLGVGGGSGGGGVAGVGGGGGGGGCPLEGNIEDLLEELGLTKYVPVFQSAEVDLSTLCIMSEQDFRELGILKGPRVKIMHHIGSR